MVQYQATSLTTVHDNIIIGQGSLNTSVGTTAQHNIVLGNSVELLTSGDTGEFLVDPTNIKSFQIGNILGGTETQLKIPNMMNPFNENPLVSGYVLSSDTAGDLSWIANGTVSTSVQSIMSQSGGISSGSAPSQNLLNATNSNYYNLATVNSNCVGYWGGVYDGNRYIYYIPNITGYLLKYDTTKPLTNTSSYVIFNMTAVNAQCMGWGGAIYDGKRYLYFIPYLGNTTGSGASIFCVYDTTLPMTSTTSYTTYDLGALNSNLKAFRAGCFDGTYIYLGFVDDGVGNAYVCRYNTTLSFTISSSYQYFQISGSIYNGSSGCIFDGQYVYFIPDIGLSGSALFVYDTTQDFTTSYFTYFDTTTITGNAKQFAGAVFDGRYVYFVPNVNSILVRYDTTLPFTSTASYQSYNIGETTFNGGVFDGRYLYLIPWTDNSSMVVYDITKLFTSSTSYTTFNTSSINSSCAGFSGGIVAGAYMYLSPYFNSGNSGYMVQCPIYTSTNLGPIQLLI